MLAIMMLLLPLFILSGLGWALSKTAWLAPAWQKGLSDLTAQLLFPCLLFNGTYQNGIADDVPMAALLTFYLPVVALFIVLTIARFHQRNCTTVALAATYSNNVFIGVPLLTQVLGASSLRFAFPIIAFHSLLVFLLYYMASAWHREQKQGWWRGLQRSVKNPIVLSLLGGLIFNLLQIPLPEFLQTSLKMLSSATLPCALLVLGAALAGLQIKHFSTTLLTVSCKIILLPMGVYLLSHYYFAFDPAITAVMVLMSACPTGINAFPVAQNNGDDASVVSSSILLSTLLCTITLPLWVALLS